MSDLITLNNFRYILCTCNDLEPLEPEEHDAACPYRKIGGERREPSVELVFDVPDNEQIATPDPWTTITADPATLPEEMRAVDFAFIDLSEDFPEQNTHGYFGGYRDNDGWHFELTQDRLPSHCRVYVWRYKSDPPPYPSADEQNEERR